MASIRKLIKEEISDQNIVKVEVESDLEDESFLNAKDFFRIKKICIFLR